MQFIPTNDCFHHLLRLLRLHKDKTLIVDMFAAQGFKVSNSKLKSWDTKTGEYKDCFREMPRAALDAFIDELYKRKLVTNSE